MSHELPDFNPFGPRWPEPPDRAVWPLLGLGGMPETRDEIAKAFHRKVRQLHPDMNTLDPGAWKQVDDGEQFETVKWAREILEKKLPEAVTDKKVARAPFDTRNGCKGCKGERINSYTGEPYLHLYGGRWIDYCAACVTDAQNAEAREKRRLARANRTCQRNDCGKTFTPTRSDGRYCSNACRQRAHRQRVAARPARQA